jgi:hypothetical protein
MGSLTVACIFELTQEGLSFKYFGLGGAIVNAANGAILVQDQRYWIHFNVFAVPSPETTCTGTGCTGCTGRITNSLGRAKVLLTVGIFRIRYYDAYVVVNP